MGEELNKLWDRLWDGAHKLETIQVVLDAKLLRATDRAARRQKLNRSALIREAIRQHLRRLNISELEELDRRGYAAIPQDAGGAAEWEGEAVSPPE